MRFVPSVRVRTRLTLAFLVVVALSWIISTATYRYFLSQDLGRINHELGQRGVDGPIHMEGPMGRLYFPRHGDDGGPDGGPHHGDDSGPPPGQHGFGDPNAPHGPHGPDDHGGPGDHGGPPGPGGPHNPNPMHDNPHHDGNGPTPTWGLEPAVYRNLPVQAGIGVILSLLAGWLLSRWFTRPLASLARGARAFHEREFGHRIVVSGNDEFSEVAATMNEMAQRVGAQIRELEEDARRRQQVLADVAHELRSPVATLAAMTAALQDGVADQPERRIEALAYMRDSAARMQRLVSDLLEVARLDLREIPLVCAPVDLRELAEDTIQTHVPQADRAGIALAPPEQGEPIIVEADRLRLSQVLDNLVENALTYAGTGAEVCVQVTANPPGFIVEDSGAGIAAQHLPFIFDAFYRADKARTPGDNHTGLGLRIARGLIESHGGTLNLESQEGQGTRVTITLPPSAPSLRP